MAGKRTVEIFGTKFILVRGPPWTYKKPKFPILKRYNLPKPMIAGTPLGAQQIKFAQVATSQAFGQTGKVLYKGVLMPRTSFVIAQGVRGSTGGKSKEQRRSERHEAALARLSSIGGAAPVSRGIAYPGY